MARGLADGKSLQSFDPITGILGNFGIRGPGRQSGHGIGPQEVIIRWGQLAAAAGTLFHGPGSAQVVYVSDGGSKKGFLGGGRVKCFGTTYAFSSAFSRIWLRTCPFPAWSERFQKSG